MVLFTATPSYNDAMFFFINDELMMSKLDLSLVSIFTILSVLIGILLYRYYLKRFSFKALITAGTLLSFLFSFLAYFQVKRYNLVFHISDFVLLIFTNSINNILAEIFTMPMLSLAAMLCPKKLEATGYSVFMASLNLGTILSGLFGSLLIDLLNISKDDYSNLAKLILICNILTLLPLPGLIFLDKSHFQPINEDRRNKMNLDEELKNLETNENVSNLNLDLDENFTTFRKLDTNRGIA
jgi:MFS family permease